MRRPVYLEAVALTAWTQDLAQGGVITLDQCDKIYGLIRRWQSGDGMIPVLVDTSSVEV